MRQSSAPVTIAIVLVNCLVFIYVHTMLDGARETQRFVYDFGLNFSEFWIRQKVWQPVTSMFVHTSLIHFAFNMLAVWSVGTPLEMTLNSGRFTFLYFVSGLTGSLFLLIFNADSNAAAIGASGAVFGLLGALAVFYPRARLLVFFIPMRAITAAAILAVLSIAFYIFQQLTFIAHMAHLGGLVGGLLYSKFALGLQFGQGDAAAGDPNAANSGGARAQAPTGRGESLIDRLRGGGTSSAPADNPRPLSRAERSAKEEEILRLMRGISGESAEPQQPKPAAADDSVEEQQAATPSEQTPSSPASGPPSPQSEPVVSETPEPPPKESRQRLEYDPETGRFHIRE